MKKINLLILMLVLFNSFFMFNPTGVSACSCASPQSVETELENKTAVFSGKVIKIQEKSTFSFSQSSADPVSVLFEVKSIWKGVNQSQVIVSTAMSSASCGFEFVEGNDYLVYAYGEGDQLGTGLCERTTLLQNANKDLKVLGVSNAPTEKVNLEPSFDSSLYWAIGSGTALFLAVIYLFIRRRRLNC